MENGGVVEKAARILGYPSVKESKKKQWPPFSVEGICSSPYQQVGYGKSFCYAAMWFHLYWLWWETKYLLFLQKVAVNITKDTTEDEQIRVQKILRGNGQNC